MADQSSQKPLLVVVGATGSQGGAVLRYFAAHPDKHPFALRGLTRNPNSAASQALSSLGIEMVQAELLDLASLTRAFAGAHFIFANTDSVQLVVSALQKPDLLKPGQTPSTYAQDLEGQMGRNIRDAAKQTEGLQRLVWSTLASPLKWSKGKYRRVTMWDAKEDIAELLAAEKGLADKLSLLLVGFYAGNALHGDTMAPKKQADGVYELAMPISGDAALPMADLDEDLGSWVHALLQAEPGVTLLGQSEAVSFPRWLKLWGRQVGVPTRYRQDTVDEFAARVPGIGLPIAEMFRFTEEYSLQGGTPNLVYPEQLRGRGIEIRTTNIENHIERTDWSTLLQ